MFSALFSADFTKASTGGGGILFNFVEVSGILRERQKDNSWKSVHNFSSYFANSQTHKQKLVIQPPLMKVITRWKEQEIKS